MQDAEGPALGLAIVLLPQLLGATQRRRVGWSCLAQGKGDIAFPDSREEGLRSIAPPLLLVLQSFTLFLPLHPLPKTPPYPFIS